MENTKYDIVFSRRSLGVFERLNLWSLIVIAATGVLVALLRLIRPKHRPQEPPVIAQNIPYIGHVIGIIRHGIGYYQLLSKQHRLPIFTLRFMSNKTYVITSLQLTRIAQKHRSLSFTPFVTAWMPPLYGLDKHSMAIMKKNMNYENGKFGYMFESYDLHHGSLSPGHDTLVHLTHAALKEFSQLINETNAASDNLYAWVRHTFTVFGTNAMWGQRNPFAAKPGLENDFWLFEQRFHLLLLDSLPEVATKGAHRAREAVTKAFQDFHDEGVDGDAPKLVRERVAIGKKYGLSNEALARLDVGLAQAILINTVPASVWMLLHVYSDTSLLSQIRSEITQICDNGHIDPAKIREACPVLISTWQEVLRCYSYLPQGRTLLEDTMLDDRFLLTKGATVLIPSGVIHADEEAWGPNAHVFDPFRFMPDHKKAPSAAFRAFGGGSLMCPGRHFAATEVLIFVATMVAGFELERVDEKKMSAPEPDTYNPSLGILKPVETPRVQIKRREGWERVVWSF